MVYYNEHDKGKAAWLRELVKAGVVAKGEVDERSVLDVAPSDLVGYTQCHFFAGIGVWSYALRNAGWPDDQEAWTGSCPCQSFSAAGKRLGFADERHLWPFWFWLISQRRPGVVFGEQVASSDALAWLDLVSADLEGEGYAIGALDLCAAGFGAPHPRQRLYWVADTFGKQFPRAAAGARPSGRGLPSDSGTSGRMADTGLSEPPRPECEPGKREGNPLNVPSSHGRVGGFWGDAEWIPCKDGKHRPVEPGTFPLVDGAPARVLRLCGYGDCIVAPQAEEFVRAYKADERRQQRICISAQDSVLAVAGSSVVRSEAV